jgi:hypothetical protein
VPVRLPVTVATDAFGSKCLSVPTALIAGLQLSELIMHGIFVERQHNWQIFLITLLLPRLWLVFSALLGHAFVASALNS